MGSQKDLLKGGPYAMLLGPLDDFHHLGEEDVRALGFGVGGYQDDHARDKAESGEAAEQHVTLPPGWKVEVRNVGSISECGYGFIFNEDGQRKGMVRCHTPKDPGYAMVELDAYASRKYMSPRSKT